MKYLLCAACYIAFSSLFAQSVLYETQSNQTLRFEPILLVSAAFSMDQLSSKPPQISGLPVHSPSVSPTVQLRFSISPPHSGSRVIDIAKTPLDVEYEIGLSVLSLPSLPGVQLNITPQLSIDPTRTPIVYTTTGGCSGIGQTDGVFYSLTTDLSTTDYALWRSGIHQTTLQWNVY